MAKENVFQKKLIQEIKRLFRGCMVFKMNANYIQGFPDLLVLYKKKWAALECKQSKNAHHQPNQDHYINRLDKMSFARFIYPENREEVLNELQQTFKSGR